jgi:hypothetical protein
MLRSNLEATETLAVGTTLAKKKQAKPSPEFRTVGMRTTVAWADWLERAAKHYRTDVAKLIDAAVAKYARDGGFAESPPERIP